MRWTGQLGILPVVWEHREVYKVHHQQTGAVGATPPPLKGQPDSKRPTPIASVSPSPKPGEELSGITVGLPGQILEYSIISGGFR